MGFFRSFLPLLGHNLNIPNPISDLIPPQVYVIKVAGKICGQLLCW